MSRVARSSACAAPRCGWSIHTDQIFSSVFIASRGSELGSRLKSSSSNPSARAGRLSRRAAMSPRISMASVIAIILVEIARGRYERSEKRALVVEPACDQMHDVAVALDRALHSEKLGAKKFTALALDEAVPNHDVHVARLVLERDKNHTARRIRTLPAGHETCI